MRSRNLILLGTLMASQVGLTQVTPAPVDKGSYMVCEVAISQEGRLLSQHLITSYKPLLSSLHYEGPAYHYPEVITSDCVMQPFNSSYNNENLHLNEETGEYIDLCYVIENGVTAKRNGMARFCLNTRSQEKFYEMNYLNLEDPLKVQGSTSGHKKIGAYDVDVDCKNTLMEPFDPLWSEIRRAYITDEN